MTRTDLPLAELRDYRPALHPPSDFREFWDDTLADARAAREPAQLTPHTAPAYRTVDVHDVVFTGFGGHPVHAWAILPRGDEPAGCVVRFGGYGTGRGTPGDHLRFAVAGLAVLAMDNRAQGTVAAPGATGDPGAGDSNAEVAGLMTRGVLDAGSYYYRRLIVDAVRAIETAADLDRVDASRIATFGSSQGGALALASTALTGDSVRLCIAEVPFLCHVRRALDVAIGPPYRELTRYLAARPDHMEQVLQTLGYFDCMNFAPLLRARALVSAAMMDEVCPPSTVFAMYNHLACAKELTVLDFCEHEVPAVHAEARLNTLAEALG